MRRLLWCMSIEASSRASAARRKWLIRNPGQTGVPKSVNPRLPVEYLSKRGITDVDGGQGPVQRQAARE